MCVSIIKAEKRAGLCHFDETKASNETLNLELAFPDDDDDDVAAVLCGGVLLFWFCLIPFIVHSAAVDYECYIFFYFC